ncbi:hypothetical protein T439DRAFT_330269 [Meredithblackwellia eburnea MCA 4105]
MDHQRQGPLVEQDLALGGPTPLAPKQCSKCGKKLSRRHDLERHERTHDNQKERFICPVEQCGAHYSRRDHMLRHVKSAHKAPNTSKRSIPKPGHEGCNISECSRRNRPFKNLTWYKKHMLKHHPSVPLSLSSPQQGSSSGTTASEVRPSEPPEFSFKDLFHEDELDHDFGRADSPPVEPLGTPTSTALLPSPPTFDPQFVQNAFVQTHNPDAFLGYQPPTPEHLQLGRCQRGSSYWRTKAQAQLDGARMLERFFQTRRIP